MRVALGNSKSFDKLKADRPVLEDLQTITNSRRGDRETPVLTTLEQIHVVIDSKTLDIQQHCSRFQGPALGSHHQYAACLWRYISPKEAPSIVPCIPPLDSVTRGAWG